MPSKRSSRKKAQEPLDPQEYVEFIAQLELQNIWLSDVKCSGDTGIGFALRTEFDLNSRVSYDNWEGGLDIQHTYELTISAMLGDPISLDFGEAEFTIEATYEVELETGISMTDALMQPFTALNLPVYTWPYFRELVSSMMGRMGWQSYTLPSMHMGADQDVEAVAEPVAEPIVEPLLDLTKKTAGKVRKPPADKRKG